MNANYNNYERDKVAGLFDGWFSDLCSLHITYICWIELVLNIPLAFSFI